MVDTSGGYFEFDDKSAFINRMGIQTIVGNHISSVFQLFGTQTKHICTLDKHTHTHIGHMDSDGSHVDEVKFDSGKFMAIPDIVVKDTFGGSLLYLVPKLACLHIQHGKLAAILK